MKYIMMHFHGYRPARLLAVLLLAAGLVIGGAGTAHAYQPEEEQTGAQPTAEGFSHTCAACHGTNGQLQGEAFPALAGMAKDPFIKAMKDFRDLKRPSSIMSHIAEGYNDKEIEMMASHFSAMKPDPMKAIPYEDLGNFREVK